jgi:ribosomal protein L11 methyltransferase
MTWLRLSISCPQECLDDLKDLLENFDASSISYSPASSEPVFDDLSGRQSFWKVTTLTALLDPDIDLDILMACVRNRIGTSNIISHKIDLLKDEDWEGAFKAGFGPIMIRDRLCVYPSWAVPPEGIPYSIQLDPGLAFGTGTHETTSLCLEWLADNPVQGKRIIDYGCGSGILGIAAAKLGAESVMCIDIDPQAINATLDNAKSNEVHHLISVRSDNMDAIPSADILVANILLEPLLHLASRLSSCVPKNGMIVLSGILANQVEACKECYSQWFDMTGPVFKNEWAMLTGGKKIDLL